MTLTFTYRPSFGHARFYAASPEAEAVRVVSRRKCLDLDDLAALNLAGFEIRIRSAVGNAETNFAGLQQLLRGLKGSAS